MKTGQINPFAENAESPQQRVGDGISLKRDLRTRMLNLADVHEDASSTHSRRARAFRTVANMLPSGITREQEEALESILKLDV